MIYTQDGRQCKIVGRSKDQEDQGVVIVQVIPEEGKEISGLSEFKYYIKELKATAGAKEIRKALSEVNW